MYDFEEDFKRDKKNLKFGMIYNDFDLKMV